MFLAGKYIAEKVQIAITISCIIDLLLIKNIESGKYEIYICFAFDVLYYCNAINLSYRDEKA